ncbi:MAG TPA: hypothetical protein VFI97_07380 [Arthrobacter sp.]|nr:hypothetical protein [Arthrobacter sp.]
MSSDWDKPSVARGGSPVNVNSGNESDIGPNYGRASELVLNFSIAHSGVTVVAVMVLWLQPQKPSKQQQLNQLDYLRKRGMVDADEYARNRRAILKSKGH